jgi:epoxyqueuosine reductase
LEDKLFDTPESRCYHYVNSDIMVLNNELRAFLSSRGADMVGFADLGEIPANIRRSLPFGISIGVALDPEIIREISDGPTRRYYDEYVRVNNLLDTLGRSTVEFLKRNGCEAISLSATYGENPATLSTPLPHKTVATRAGLGWIGKCALLVTREYGSALRVTTVLTGAEIEPGQPVNDSMCGECIACVTACPAHAPSGKHWQRDVPRDSFYNAFACRSTSRELAMKRIGIREAICGICISVCPWTKKYIEKL